MAEALLRACPRGHPSFTGRGCPLCRGQADRRRGTATSRGYDVRWRRARDSFLREFPLCGQRPREQRPVMSKCFEENRVTAASQVDHVVPHRGNNPALFWDRDGWQSMCGTCHKRKTQAGL